VIVELHDLDADREGEGKRVRQLLAPERDVDPEVAPVLAPERRQQQHQPKRGKDRRAIRRRVAVASTHSGNTSFAVTGGSAAAALFLDTGETFPAGANVENIVIARRPMTDPATPIDDDKIVWPEPGP